MTKCPSCGRHSFTEKGVDGVITWILIVATIVSIFTSGQYWIFNSLLMPRMIPILLVMQSFILAIMWMFYAGLINMMAKGYFNEGE